MSDKRQIATLLEETDNAGAWFEKLSKELASDPDNETVLRLLILTKELYDRRVRLLIDMGFPADNLRCLSKPETKNIEM